MSYHYDSRGGRSVVGVRALVHLSTPDVGRPVVVASDAVTGVAPDGVLAGGEVPAVGGGGGSKSWVGALVLVDTLPVGPVAGTLQAHVTVIVRLTTCSQESASSLRE